MKIQDLKENTYFTMEQHHPNKLFIFGQMVDSDVEWMMPPSDFDEAVVADDPDEDDVDYGFDIDTSKSVYTYYYVGEITEGSLQPVAELYEYHTNAGLEVKEAKVTVTIL